MTTTLAIAQRELKSFFVSTIAWIITAAFLAISGFLFSAILLNTNEASLRFLISNLSVILLFIAPFLTMRLLAEENRLGHVELLLTNPVRDVEVVLGKFLGVMGFVIVMLLCTLYFPALLFMFGTPDTGPMVTGYVGVVLQAAAFVAIGLAISSMTRESDRGGVPGVRDPAGHLAERFDVDVLGKPLGDIMKYLSVTSHFQDFSRGVIDSSHMIYFISVAVAALFVAYLSLQTRRWRG